MATLGDATVLQFPVRTSSSSSPRSCAQFGIDGCEPFFWGYHSGATWNGWDVPKFLPEVVEVMMKHFNDSSEEILRWSGSTLVVTEPGGDGPIEIEPDEEGKYAFDGWAWVMAPAEAR